MDHATTIRQSAARAAISDFTTGAGIAARRLKPSRAGAVARRRASQALGDVAPALLRLWATSYIAAMLALMNIADFNLDRVEWGVVHSIDDATRAALIRRSV